MQPLLAPSGHTPVSLTFSGVILGTQGTMKSQRGEPVRDPLDNTTTRFLTRSDVAFIFHLVAFVMYLRVWMWHTTPAALQLPGASGFGWFFRYLTFCSYTMQLLQLLICCLAHVVKNRKWRTALSATADRLSCALFGLVNTVTVMFYAVENATHGLVEGGASNRPWWLDTAVHAGNSAVAWADLFIVEQRSFSGHSRHLALLMAVVYSGWLLLVRQRNGRFPYPVLNSLPFPLGFLGFLAAGIAVVVGSFELGRITKRAQQSGLRRAEGHRRRKPGSGKVA